VGQKIHPTGFRLGITQEHRSRWFGDHKRYPELLQEDYKIRRFVEKNLSSAGISEVRIERKADQIDLEVRTARPGVVVGRVLRLGAGEALRLIDQDDRDVVLQTADRGPPDQGRDRPDEQEPHHDAFHVPDHPRGGCGVASRR